LPLAQKPEVSPDGSQRQDAPVYQGLTVKPHPKFLVHIPQIAVQEAKFTLVKEINADQEEPVYETKVALRGTPGVVSFSLPANSPELEVGNTYKWSVQVICDSNSDEGSVNPTVGGEVRRIPPTDAIANIEKVPPSDRPAMYADANAWYDSIAALAELRTQAPNDTTLKDDWVNILKSVNLDPIAEAPVLSCCTAPNQ
jgi:hypothetical protein